MNIFKTDPCPVMSAKWISNKLVSKMPTETAQLLATCFSYELLSNAPKNKDESIRRWFNPKHPSARYAKATLNNFLWVLSHGESLCKEYKRRYKQEHFQTEFFQWCRQNYYQIPFEKIELEPIYLAMPDKYKNFSEDYLCYRAYINGEKSYSKWPSIKDIPFWYKDHSEKSVDKSFVDGVYIKR